MSNYNSWSPLKEVWLGDCYPKHFYNHLDNEALSYKDDGDTWRSAGNTETCWLPCK
jgi:hypothetical protein